MRTICAALLVLGLGVFALGCKKRAESINGGAQEAPAAHDAPGPAVALPTAATWRGSAVKTPAVTGPVDASGQIDYAAALNQRLSKGVTAENNANVAIWKVFGPTSPQGDTVPAGFFDKMGMQTPPTNGNYFVGLRKYAEGTVGPGVGTAAYDVIGTVTSRPWTATEYPTHSGWLKANEKPMAALREAVKRTHYYNPMIPEQGPKGSKGLLTALLPGAQACREVAVAFACRAMLYLGQNRTDEAWQDLIACHRLARLVGRGGALIEGLVGLAIEQIACRAEIAYLDRAPLDAKAVEQCLRDLAALPAPAPVADKIDLCDRFVFLDIISQTRQQGLEYLQSFAEEGKLQDEFANWLLVGIDWTPAIKTANKWFDRLSACAREPSRAARVQKWAEFETDIRALKAKATDFAGVAKMFREKNYSGEAKGEAVGDILIVLMLPAANKVIDASDRVQQTFETVAVAFALAWYQRVNGRYPDSLARLAPKYLTAVPLDLFTSKDLIYRPSANGYLLYSVGVNGRDDGGRGYDDQPAGDDLVVRVPRAAKP